MNKHHITLTEEEREIVSQIDLREELPLEVDGHSVYVQNQKPILALLKLLSERGAIPKQRIAYWDDPKLNPGRPKGSHKDIFARNGSEGVDAYTHPHFIPYLRYFLFGANLPQTAIDEFESQVGNPKWFSGSDIIALSKKTRAIVRKYNLRNYDCAEEFFKLALDNGLNPYNAESVRKAAREAARR